MKTSKAVLYGLLRPMLTVFIKHKYKATVIGKENIPKKGPVILCGNHTNNMDCLLLGSCTKRTIYYMAKKELHIGLKKHFFRAVGTIPIDRKASSNPDARNAALDVLSDGKVIGIFPEGTINRTDDIIMPFKFGAVSLAQKSGATVVPFAIVGSYNDKNLIIEFSKPYQIKSKNLEKENNILMRKVTKLIVKNRKRIYGKV